MSSLIGSAGIVFGKHFACVVMISPISYFPIKPDPVHGYTYRCGAAHSSALIGDMLLMLNASLLAGGRFGVAIAGVFRHCCSEAVLGQTSESG